MGCKNLLRYIISIKFNYVVKSGKGIKSIQRRNRLFIGTTVTSIIILLVIAPIMFNFRGFFQIGMYDIDDDFLINYSDGSGGLNVHMYVDYQVNGRYTINTYFSAIASGDVENNGIITLNMSYYEDTESHFPDYYEFYPFVENKTNIINIPLEKDVNFSCIGVAEIQLVSEGVPHNETINFGLSLLIPLSRSDFIEIDLAIYVLFFLYFFSYIIIPIILLKVFKPTLGLKIKEEDMKKDDKFLGYIQKQANDKRKEEIIKKG